MRKHVTLGVALLFALVGCPSNGQDRGVPAAGDAPPPLLLDLQLGDRSIPAELDRPVTIDAPGGPLTFTIRARPYRVLEAQGVRFRFPADYTYRHETTPSFTKWILSGDRAKVMLFHYTGRQEPDALCTAIARDMVRRNGPHVQTTQTPAEIVLAGEKVHGVHLVAPLVGGVPPVTTDVFVFVKGQTAYSLLLQDVGEAGTDEGQAARKLLEDSFAYSE